MGMNGAGLGTRATEMVFEALDEFRIEVPLLYPQEYFRVSTAERGSQPSLAVVPADGPLDRLQPGDCALVLDSPAAFGRASQTGRLARERVSLSRNGVLSLLERLSRPRRAARYFVKSTSLSSVLNNPDTLNPFRFA